MSFNIHSACVLCALCVYMRGFWKLGGLGSLWTLLSFGGPASGTSSFTSSKLASTWLSHPQPCASLDLSNHFPTRLILVVSHLLLPSRQGRPPEEGGLGGLWKKGEKRWAKLWRRKTQSHGSLMCILKVILRFWGKPDTPSRLLGLFLGGTVPLQDMVWEPGFLRGSSSTRLLWA